MTPAERNYGISDKEALLIIKGLQHWRAVPTLLTMAILCLGRYKIICRRDYKTIYSRLTVVASKVSTSPCLHVSMLRLRPAHLYMALHACM